MSTAQTTNSLKGGEWLIRESEPQDIFIPEEFNEEQHMIRDMCNQFLETEVMPQLDAIDSLEPG
ncbi:MAG TPA: acyl-CoA dehydrogenase, partial [Flavisolibacter sp.]|nr:acyl-CoA dehydrogenase [Flavisolibacter sp.]